MGLGYVVLGYLTILGIMPSFGVAISYMSIIPIIGCVLIIIGLNKLSSPYPYVSTAKWATLPLTVVAAVKAVRELYGILAKVSAENPPQFISLFDSYIIYFQIAALIVFHIFLLSVLRRIMKDLGDKRRADKASRNIYMMFVYYTLAIISSLPIKGLEETWMYFSMPVVLLGLIWYILNVAVIYGCYMKLTQTAIEIHKDV